MAITHVGKLTRIMSLETDEAMVVIPRGTYVYVESDKNWPHEIKDSDFVDIVNMLNACDRSETIIKMFMDHGWDPDINQMEEVIWKLTHLLESNF